MRRSFAVSLALLSLGSIASIVAPGCNNAAFDVQDLCGWIADECNCYRRFAAGVAPSVGGVASPKCGIALDANNDAVDPVTGQVITDDTTKQTFGAFSARDKLDVCLLLRAEGGQIVFDPPLDVAAFPNAVFGFKIVDGSGDVCATGSYGSITNFSIGFPAPAAASGTGGTGGAGTGGTGGTGGNTPEDICREAHDPAAAPIASGTFEMKPGDASQIVETTCADGEVHRFNLYQLNKCDGNELNEKNFKALLPTAEIEADPGAANVDGFIRMRVFWPPTDPNMDLSGQKPHAVEYFHCLIPGASAPCFDDALSDGETDVDCGGICPQDCDDGKDCLVGADCKSKVCEKDAMGFLKCISPPCGDLDVTGNETCDDGNVMPGDGCSDICQEEPGYTCAGPGPCVDINECAENTDNCPTGTDCVNTPGSFTCECEPGFAWDGMKCVGDCGNGDLKPPEGCDDGNIVGGDGCTPNCTKEPGFTCMGEGPGSCVDIIECDTMGACLPTETCTNTVGSFTCTCNTSIAAVCNNVCIDTQSDVFNCGGCDNVCLPNQGCFGGKCCQAPANALCGGVCTDTMTNANNCGMCGNTCTAPMMCVGGMCQ